MRLLLTAAAVVAMVLGVAVVSAQADTTPRMESTPPWTIESLKGTVRIEVPEAGANAAANPNYARAHAAGSIVRYPGSQGGDRAMVLTAGHEFSSYGASQNGPALIDGPPPNPIVVTLMDPDNVPVRTLGVERVEYAKWADATPDLALIRLSESYDDLMMNDVVTGPTITSDIPGPGTVVRFLATWSGRLDDCTLTDGYNNHLAAFGCGRGLLEPGDSGSTEVRWSDSGVVGVANDVFYPGNGQPELMLSTPTAPVLTCLTGDRHIDLNVPGCQLPR
jgi:hypothetical protein